MLDFRTEYSRSVIQSLSKDLSVSLYLDKASFEKSVNSIWRQVEDNILTQNTFFYNYQYALYTIDIFKQLAIFQSYTEEEIPLENLKICVAILFCYHAGRRFKGSFSERNLAKPGFKCKFSEVDFIYDAELISQTTNRSSAIITKIQDNGLNIKGNMADEMIRSIDPFDIRHSRYEYLAVLIRSSLVLGLMAFPGLIERINRVRKDHLLAFPDNSEFASDLISFKRYLYENFWAVQYPSILDGINVLKRDKTNMTINQLTYNLQRLKPVAEV